MQPQEDAGARAAAVGGVVGWLGQVVGDLSDKEILACAGWLSRAGCDSAAAMRTLTRDVIIKNTHKASHLRTKLLIAAGYLEASAAPPASAGQGGTTQRLVASGPGEAPPAAAAELDDGSAVTDPETIHAPAPPRPATTQEIPTTACYPGGVSDIFLVFSSL